MFILETGAIFVALSICCLCVGYNLKTAGYSRKKMLEGQSFEYQMANRKSRANTFTDIGISMGIISVITFFIILGMTLSIETIETVPKKINVMVAQDKTVVVADGKVYTIEGMHNYIKRIYFTKGLNSYGIPCKSNIMMEYKDQWER